MRAGKERGCKDWGDTEQEEKGNKVDVKCRYEIRDTGYVLSRVDKPFDS